MPTLYKGFSTNGRKKKFRVTDFDLVKQDLINQFSIRKGEKLMQPNYGTVIWSLLFEQLTDTLKQTVITDITAIASSDPRLRLTNITVTDFQHGIQIELDLTYIPSNQSGQLKLSFDKNSQTLTTA